MSAFFGIPVKGVCELDERSQTGRGLKINISALPAIAPIGAAFGNIFFSAKANNAIAASSGDKADLRFIDKHLVGLWG